MENQELRIDINNELVAPNTYKNNECKSIDEVIEFLVIAKNAGAKQVAINASVLGDECDEITIQPFVVRLETDEEVAHREALEQEWADRRKREQMEGERQIYERLKAKYEPNG